MYDIMNKKVTTYITKVQEIAPNKTVIKNQANTVIAHYIDTNAAPLTPLQERTWSEFQLILHDMLLEQDWFNKREERIKEYMEVHVQ
jgi:hypothetical protein